MPGWPFFAGVNEGADWGLAASVGADASCQTTRDSVPNPRKRTIDDIHVSVSTKKAIMRALGRCRAWETAAAGEGPPLEWPSLPRKGALPRE